MRWWNRRRESDLDRELRAHLELEAEEQGGSGDAALRAFGNLTLVREDMRAVWVWTWLERLAQDLLYAVRVLRRRPGFAATAVLSLALGIGANTALFSLLDGLLLRSLPVDRPHELLRLSEDGRDDFAYPTYDQLRRGSTQLDRVILMSRILGQIRDAGERRYTEIQIVSDNYFDALGVRALRGRFFQPGEWLAVISEDYWRRRYGADPAAIGSHIQLRDRQITIAGVAAPGFHGAELDRPVEIWLPFEQLEPASSPNRIRGRWLRVMGRLRPGASRAGAEAEIAALVGPAITLQPAATGYSNLRRRLLQPLLLLELVAGLVLLVTCANLANLVKAGAAARERELSTRQAVGASRGRLVRQLFTESAVLAATGGIFALLAARWMHSALLSFLPADQSAVAANLRFAPDLRLIGFAVLICFAACLWFGLIPALRATRAVSAMRNQSWMSRGLIVSEVAICTLLLIVAGVFVRTLQNLRGQETGFHEDRVLVADVEPPREYPEVRRDQIIEELRQRAATLPGVQAASFSHIGPMSGSPMEYRVRPEGVGVRGNDAMPAIEQRISPGFLAAMGTVLVAGRDVADTDDEHSPPVAIVNEAFARRFLTGRDPIGGRFVKEGGSRKIQVIEIVGLVKDSRWINLREDAPAMYYVPYRQQGGTPVVRFAIRASGDLNALAANLVQSAHTIDRQMILRNVVPFREIVDRTLVVERLVAQVSAAFGILALLIAAVGLYGVLAYSVVRRKREIGVRIAVGASRRAVEWMMLRESLALLAIGFAIGAPAALSLTHLVRSMLFGLQPHDPAIIAAALAVLAAATLAAAYIPARRAAATEPMLALREE